MSSDTASTARIRAYCPRLASLAFTMSSAVTFRLAKSVNGSSKPIFCANSTTAGIVFSAIWGKTT